MCNWYLLHPMAPPSQFLKEEGGPSCHNECAIHLTGGVNYFVVVNPNPHGMFWTKVIYDLASLEPYSLGSLNSKNLKKYLNVRKGLGNTLSFYKVKVKVKVI